MFLVICWDRCLGMSVKKSNDSILVYEVQEIFVEHAEAVCFRCKLRLKDHGGADHLFFEHPNEVPEEECN